MSTTPFQTCYCCSLPPVPEGVVEVTHGLCPACYEAECAAEEGGDSLFEVVGADGALFGMFGSRAMADAHAALIVRGGQLAHVVATV